MGLQIMNLKTPRNENIRISVIHDNALDSEAGLKTKEMIKAVGRFLQQGYNAEIDPTNAYDKRYVLG